MSERRPVPEGDETGQLLELDRRECFELLHRCDVGRVVFVDHRGPVALPVNYVVDHDDVVFRTSSWSSVLASTYVGNVGFEVDQVDDVERIGWSVLARGRVRAVDDPPDRRHVEMLNVTPWAPGDRNRYLRLHVHDITGRRIVRNTNGTSGLG